MLLLKNQQLLPLSLDLQVEEVSLLLLMYFLGFKLVLERQNFKAKVVGVAVELEVQIFVALKFSLQFVVLQGEFGNLLVLEARQINILLRNLVHQLCFPFQTLLKRCQS